MSTTTRPSTSHADPAGARSPASTAIRAGLTAALAATVLAAAPSPAGAHVAHTVQQGETLWSIAAASNLTTRALAVFNGLPEDAAVIAGQTVMVPSEGEAAIALGTAGPGAPHESGPEPVAPAGPAGGSHIAQPGETLSGIAVRAGVGLDALAAANGLDPGATLLAGRPLALPTPGTGTPPVAPETEPLESPPAAAATPAGPQATPGTVTEGEIASIAAEHGIDPSLATAIAWQESGFQSGLTSSAGARGVMQIMPGTWTHVQRALTPMPLDPVSSQDNVRAGVVYLRHLLDETGGDPASAAAAYYQGLSSTRTIGWYDDTQRYVDNVLALRGRFGG